jgi:hypothetical protein
MLAEYALNLRNTMSLKLIYFACVLFVIGAIIPAYAQGSATVLDNSANNSTALLNNTTLNASLNESTIVPANEVPVVGANETAILSANDTAEQLNDTTPAQMPSPAAQNVAAPVQNETSPSETPLLPENVTGSAVPEETSSLPSSATQAGPTQIGPSQKSVYAIGGSARTPSPFSIDGQSLPQEAYQIGLPAKTIMDLSVMPFFTNI